MRQSKYVTASGGANTQMDLWTIFGRISVSKLMNIQAISISLKHEVNRYLAALLFSGLTILHLFQRHSANHPVHVFPTHHLHPTLPSLVAASFPRPNLKAIVFPDMSTMEIIPRLKDFSAYRQRSYEPTIWAQIAGWILSTTPIRTQSPIYLRAVYGSGLGPASSCPLGVKVVHWVYIHGKKVPNLTRERWMTCQTDAARIYGAWTKYGAIAVSPNYGH